MQVGGAVSYMLLSPRGLPGDAGCSVPDTMVLSRGQASELWAAAGNTLACVDTRSHHDFVDLKRAEAWLKA